MPDETENHILGLLREMRDENRQFREKVRQGFAKINRRFAEINLRIDGVTHIMTLLAGHIHQHEERIERLEQGSS